MRRSRSTSTSLAVVSVFILGCTDLEPPTAAAPSHPARAQGASSRRPGGWAALSKEEMWSRIVASRGEATIGIRRPGERVGVERGRRLVSQAEVEVAAKRVASIEGVTVLQRDTLLPWVRVRLANAEAIDRVRALPFVQYLEPAYLPVDERMWASLGCGGDVYTSNYTYASGFSGDVIPPTFQYMGITEAWRMSTGSGVTIGLTDTGVDVNHPEFASMFASGASGGRSFHQEGALGGPGIFACSHGTRMAGVLAAPMNGQHVTGVAWGSSLVSISQASTVGPIDSYYAAMAIRRAAELGASVIVMAWQTFDTYHAVEGEIQWWYYYRNRLFVGAAGTFDGCGSPCSGNVIFPAQLPEVLSVAPISHDGNMPGSASSGPQLDVAAYHDQPSTGLLANHPPTTLVGFKNSSNATAVVGGIAALVRAREPLLTSQQVMARIVETSGSACSDRWTWFRAVNALAAVGGTCIRPIEGAGGVILQYPYDWSVAETFTVRITGGVGPFVYSWGSQTPTFERTRTATFHFNMPADYLPYQSAVSVSVQDLGASTVAQRSHPVYVSVSGSIDCTVNPEYAC